MIEILLLIWDVNCMEATTFKDGECSAKLEIVRAHAKTRAKSHLGWSGECSTEIIIILVFLTLRNDF